MKKRVISIIRNIFDGVMIFVLFITTTVYALPSNGVIYVIVTVDQVQLM